MSGGCARSSKKECAGPAAGPAVLTAEIIWAGKNGKFLPYRCYIYMKKIILILIVLGALAGAGFLYRLYRHDMKSLTEFAAAYERFDREKSADSLAELKVKSAVRLSSMIKNEKEAMDLMREAADMAQKEFDSKFSSELTAQRKSAYARFEALGQ